MKLNRDLPQNLKQPLKVSKFVQLYLLNRQHPFKFNFLDMLNNQFTIQIGKQINCSCIPGYHDHCIHSFYVLQKIFKLKEYDPLLWKQSYSTKDLQILLQSEKGTKTKEKVSQQLLKTLKTKNQEFGHHFNQEIQRLQDMTQKSEKQKSRIFFPESPQKIATKKQHANFTSTEKPQSAQNKVYDLLLNQVKLQLKKQQISLFGQSELTFCPICHEDVQNLFMKITYETPVYQCKLICKNFYHIKCLKFWVKHQRKNLIENERYDEQKFQHRSNVRVTCPMCRNQFPQKIDSLLVQNEKTFKIYFQSHNLKCNQCKQEIFLKLYHCLLCKSTNLCDNCYKGWKHQHHDRFLMKNNKKQKWSVPPGRSAFNMSKLQFSLEYIKQISNSSTQAKVQVNMKQLFGQNYSKFIQANLPKPDIVEYLKETFVNIEKEIHKTYKAVDFSEQSLKCMACKKPSIIGMRRLFCVQKHFIDDKCLTFFLKNNFFQCPIDKTYFLEGFQGIVIDLKQNVKKSAKKAKN